MLDQNDQTFIPMPGSSLQAALGKVYLPDRHHCAAKVDPERADSWRLPADCTLCGGGGAGSGG